jgi:hypothetical protein
MNMLTAVLLLLTLAFAFLSVYFFMNLSGEGVFKKTSPNAGFTRSFLDFVLPALSIMRGYELRDPASHS